MAESVLDQLAEAGLDPACATKEAIRLKAVITEAVEDGLRAARRTMKQGQEIAEETVEDAVHAVRKYPLQTVAVTFGVALATGAVLGWLAFRRK
jgi:ElaB/YqjD/DUF883 family membrane-anchored ribosome-binding protein